MHSMNKRGLVAAFCVAALLAANVATADAPKEEAAIQFDVPAQSFEAALLQLAKQASMQLVISVSSLPAGKSPQISGKMPVREAVDRLLHDTGLGYDFVGERTLAITPGVPATPASTPKTDAPNPHAMGAEPSRSMRFAQAANAPVTDATESDEQSSTAREPKPTLQPVRTDLPEVLIRGAKTLNMDIRRTVDDVQPYVVLERSFIERSAAANLDDLLKKQLPMNAVATGYGQDFSQTTTGARSTFNLRGLGVDQTLVLVDGRRLPLAFGNGNVLQSDTSGIPLSAIERIEVLPTTAAGIYGGSATGGVINIILRRDYSGSEVRLGYENTFDSDVAQRRLDFSSGFSFDEGKTNLMLTFSHADSNELLRKDRDLDRDGYARVVANHGGDPRALDLYQFYPPLGATTNIESADGSPLVLKNGMPVGSNITYVPPRYAGVAADGGAALIANAGKYNTDLSDVATYSWGGGGAALVKLPQIDSGMLTIRREISSWLQGFLDAGYSRSRTDSPATAVSGFATLAAGTPGNPFTTAVNVDAPIPSSGSVHVDDRMARVATGLIFDLPGAWLGEADYTWGRTTHEYAAPPARMPTFAPAITTGTIDVFRDVQQSPQDISQYVYPSYLYTLSPYVNRSDDVAVRVSGPVFELPGGNVTLSGLLEHRRDRAEAARSIYLNDEYLAPPRSQEVNSAYAELRVPIVSAINRIKGVSSLELQIAARTDRYKTRGTPLNFALQSAAPEYDVGINRVSSTNPTIGLRYQPSQDLMLRASYSTGFQPPNFVQLSSVSSTQSGIGIPDPKRGNTFVGTFESITGGNPDLGPEDSQSRSLGIVLTPRFLPDLRLSVDWFRIDKSDNITQLSLPMMVVNESLFPDRVVRGPKLATDPPDWAGPIIAIDHSAINISRAQVEGYDLRLDYTLATRAFGSYSAFVAGTCQTHFKSQLVPSAPVVESIGTGAGLTDTHPLKWKANAGLVWSRNGLTLGWSAQFYDSYLAADPNDPSRIWQMVSQGNGGRVPSQVFHDVSASYSFDSAGWRGVAGSVAEGLEILGGVKNVFNTKPAFYVDYNQGLIYSPYGDPRLAVYYLSLRKAF
jgi:outer membrane receptor protein involved in Fe transport